MDADRQRKFRNDKWGNDKIFDNPFAPKAIQAQGSRGGDADGKRQKRDNGCYHEAIQ
jgi:hypothetical protein